MIAFVMALMGCVLIMYKAIWYDQFSCPDGFLLRVSLRDQGLGQNVEGFLGAASRMDASRLPPLGFLLNDKADPV